MNENKSLEELLAETEQKIMNNEFQKQFTLTYDGEDYDFILKPLSQNDFLSIYQRNQGNKTQRSNNKEMPDNRTRRTIPCQTRKNTNR